MTLLLVATLTNITSTALLQQQEQEQQLQPRRFIGHSFYHCCCCRIVLSYSIVVGLFFILLLLSYVCDLLQLYYQIRFQQFLLQQNNVVDASFVTPQSYMTTILYVQINYKFIHYGVLYFSQYQAFIVEQFLFYNLKYNIQYLDSKLRRTMSALGNRKLICPSFSLAKTHKLTS